MFTDPFGNTIIVSSGDITARADGSLNARVSGTSGNSLLGSAALLDGNATVFVTESATVTNPDGTTQNMSTVTASLSLDVIGFKQSNTATTTGTTGTSGG